jgi:hypothetical protein
MALTLAEVVTISTASPVEIGLPTIGDVASTISTMPRNHSNIDSPKTAKTNVSIAFATLPPLVLAFLQIVFFSMVLLLNLYKIAIRHKKVCVPSIQQSSITPVKNSSLNVTRTGSDTAYVLKV